MTGKREDASESARRSVMHSTLPRSLHTHTNVTCSKVAIQLESNIKASQSKLRSL